MKHLNIPALRAGDKIRFLTNTQHLFIGYVNYLNSNAVSIKGCKLLEPKEKLQDVAPFKYRDMCTFSPQDFAHIEVLEPAPF